MLQRSMDLRIRAQETDTLTHRETSLKSANRLHERREALELLEQMEAMLGTTVKEFVALEARVFELATLAVRGPNGHAWRQDLPNKENASKFYQCLQALVRYLAQRAKAANK